MRSRTLLAYSTSAYWQTESKRSLAACMSASQVNNLVYNFHYLYRANGCAPSPESLAPFGTNVSPVVDAELTGWKGCAGVPVAGSHTMSVMDALCCRNAAGCKGPTTAACDLTCKSYSLSDFPRLRRQGMVAGCNTFKPASVCSCVPAARRTWSMALSFHCKHITV